MNPPDLSYIADGLRTLAVPVDSVNLDPQNARLHDARSLEAITASLRKFGQRQPLVVQRSGMVVRAGNGRLVAAKALGWTHVAVLVVDDADALAAAYAIADNRSAEFGDWDWARLGETFEMLREQAPDLSFDDLGFNAEEIDSLSFTSAWDDMKDAREEHLTGRRETVDRGTLTLKFTKEEAAQLTAAFARRGITEVTARAVIEAVGK